MRGRVLIAINQRPTDLATIATIQWRSKINRFDVESMIRRGVSGPKGLWKS